MRRTQARGQVLSIALPARTRSRCPDPLRVASTSSVYEVTCRGNRRHDIFLDTEDRSTFVGILARTVRDRSAAARRHASLAQQFTTKDAALRKTGS